MVPITPSSRRRARRAACVALAITFIACAPAPDRTLHFPEGFLWGVSTSAQESEGNNVHSDWDAFARLGKAPPAGWAQNAYQLYETDFENAQGLHLNSFQLTIEWARLVPKKPADPLAPLRFEDVDAQELAHYHAVIASAVAHGLTPVVTVTHFSLPDWVDSPAGFDAASNSFTDGSLGGWTDQRTGQALARYGEFLAREFGDQVKWWLTIDEPMVVLVAGFLGGSHPPGFSSLSLVDPSLPNGLTPIGVMRNMIDAHALAYRAMKAVRSELQVSFAHNSVAFEPLHPHSSADIAASDRVAYAYDFAFLDALTTGAFDPSLNGSGPAEQHPEWAGSLDYVGVNYYSRAVVVDAPNFLPPLRAVPCVGDLLRSAPELLHALGCPLQVDLPAEPGMKSILLAYTQRYQLPLFITESGFIDTPEGKARRLVQMLGAMHEAMSQGAQVLGYSYWTLNYDYEWNDGWTQNMGLFTVQGFGDGHFPGSPDGGPGAPGPDTDFTRVPLHPISDVYAEIAGHNAVSAPLLSAWGADAGQ